MDLLLAACECVDPFYLNLSCFIFPPLSPPLSIRRFKLIHILRTLCAPSASVWLDRTSAVTSRVSSTSVEAAGSGSTPTTGSSTTGHSLVAQKQQEIFDCTIICVVPASPSLESMNQQEWFCFVFPIFWLFSWSFQFNLLFVLSCDIPLLFLTGCFSYAHNFCLFLHHEMFSYLITYLAFMILHFIGIPAWLVCTVFVLPFFV